MIYYVCMDQQPSPEAPKKTILVVEDDNLISSYLVTKVQKHYNAIAATDTQKAYAALQQQPVDLIVLDIMLPNEDGFSFLQQIKAAQSPHKGIPVLILSNFDQQEQIDRGKALGAIDYLVKGNHSPQEVVVKITEILQSTPPAA